MKTGLALVVGMVVATAAIFTYFPRTVLPAMQPAAAALPITSAAPRESTAPITSGAPGEWTGETNAVTEVYERVGPAVVNITSTQQGVDLFGRPLRQEGSGSGFIIDSEGHVITNQHVVSGASRLDVTLADGTTYVGEVWAIDAPNDIALVKINAPAEKLKPLAVVPLGDSSALRVGQTVIAIGNPFGLERSATLGIVSSLGRTRPGVEQRLISNMIQTDAAINPGNSGGPLLNLRGEVVGNNAQIDSPTRGSVGVGFAIPVNTLKRYLPDLLAGKEPKHPWIGIAGRPLTPTLAERLSVHAEYGVILSSVTAGGPAARAGLRGATRRDASTADIITHLDGHVVRSVEDVAVYIDNRDPGETVRVTFMRGGQSQTADVTLAIWEARDLSGR